MRLSKLEIAIKNFVQNSIILVFFSYNRYRVFYLNCTLETLKLLTVVFGFSLKVFARAVLVIPEVGITISITFDVLNRMLYFYCIFGLRGVFKGEFY